MNANAIWERRGRGVGVKHLLVVVVLLLAGRRGWTCWECKLALPHFMLIKEEQNISMYSCLVTVGLKASKSLPFTKLN